MIINELIHLLPRFAVLSLLKVKKKKGKKSPRCVMHRGLFSRFEGTSDGIAGDGGAKGVKTFFPFYFFTFKGYSW